MVSILGSNPLLWCCPTVSPGTGLKFQLSTGNGASNEIPALHRVQRKLWDKSPHPCVCGAFCPEVHNNSLMLVLLVATDRDARAWPPRDPALENQKPFKLLDSPWTYENGNVNPALHPSNARPRPIDARSPARAYTSALPPYHPDFEHDAHPHRSYFPESVPDFEEYQRPKIRRGSEGYEVRPVNREEMLREYVRYEVERTGRYQVYEPEDTEYTGGCELDYGDEVSDDDRPLGLRG